MTQEKRRYSFDERRNYHGLKERQFNNNWNSTQENLLRERGEQSLGYKWMHDRACKKLTLYNDVIGVIGIIFGAMSGTGAFVNIIVKNFTIEIIVGIFAYIVTLSTILLKYLALETTAIEHKRASVKFQALGSEIKNQLAMFRYERKSGAEYMEAIRLQFDRIISEAPIINPSITEEFSKKFDNTNIAKPDIANGINSIAIRTRNTPQPPALEPQKNVTIEENTKMALQQEFERQLKERNKDEINKTIKYQMSRMPN